MLLTKVLHFSGDFLSLKTHFQMFWHKTISSSKLNILVLLCWHIWMTGNGDSSVAQSTIRVIERSWVWVPTGAAEFSSPRSAFCTGSYFSMFHPHVTIAACKRSQSFCQKCRWQVTAKHTYTLHKWFCMKWHGMVVWCTQNALRQQNFRVAPAM